VRRQARDALCGKIPSIARNTDLARQICSSKRSPSWYGGIIGSWCAQHEYAKAKRKQATFLHCSTRQKPRQKIRRAIFRPPSVEFRIKPKIQPSGRPLSSTPFCSTFCSNMDITTRRCIGAMTSVTTTPLCYRISVDFGTSRCIGAMTSVAATRLALEEIRVKQKSLLNLNDLWIQHQSQNVSFSRLCLEVQAKLELQAEREQPEQVEREILEHERIARLWRILEYLALLLLSILRFLLSCRKFGGFQNRQRPRCTTMPWNIWPSLVVLWGVCWMFINTPFIEFDPTQFAV